MIRPWTEVSPGVRVSTAVSYTTTTTVVLAPSGALLVDPAFTPADLEALVDDLTRAATPIAAGVSTHAHHDHLLWHPRLGEGPRYSSTGTAQAADDHRDELLEHLGPVPEPILATFGRLDPVADTDAGSVCRLPWSGAEAYLVTHDGHAPGHSAVWLPAVRTLLAGDMLSDIELPLPGDEGPVGYAVGLDALRPFVEQAVMLVPGHGHPTDRPMDRWTTDRRYLDSLLSGGDPADLRRDLPGMAEVHRSNLESVGGAPVDDLDDRLDLDR